jgi:hypothetical protein
VPITRQARRSLGSKTWRRYAIAFRGDVFPILIRINVRYAGCPALCRVQTRLPDQNGAKSFQE